MVHFFSYLLWSSLQCSCRAAVVPQQMQLLGSESWSWCWIPGRVHAEVTNPSPPWFGCVQHFLLVGRQSDAQPGNKTGLWGKHQANHRQPIPCSLRARVKMASLILAREKEMQNFFQFFKPILKASWAAIQVCVRCMLPSGTACLLDLLTFLQGGGGDEKYLMQWIHT